MTVFSEPEAHEASKFAADTVIVDGRGQVEPGAASCVPVVVDVFEAKVEDEPCVPDLVPFPALKPTPRPRRDVVDDIVFGPLVGSDASDEACCESYWMELTAVVASALQVVCVTEGVLVPSETPLTDLEVSIEVGGAFSTPVALLILSAALLDSCGAPSAAVENLS